ncbi:DnaB-like helicase N-terminal domain-containing protein [Dactylosporangium sp. CA-233914]|uniref:DnaB-like helicase N-terminal domain-containing protein n=1 Tax=Dactylosporangium sp. CA-233914 TaxID=3239934 RepID=UPI003D91534F
MNRVPPHDLTAEQAVIGSVLLAPEVLADVAETLAASDFYRPAHAMLWETLTALRAAGTPTDAVTVAAHLAEAGTLGRIGGAGYLHTLVASVPTVANAGHYAAIVAERARRRAVVDLGDRLARLARSDGDTTEVLAAGRALLAATNAPSWPAPIPLTARHAPPPYPVDSLPGWLAEMVAAVAEFTQTPADLAGCIALAALSRLPAGEPRSRFAAAGGSPAISSRLSYCRRARGSRPSSPR